MPADPCCFIDRVPQYEARDGRVYISMGNHVLAMPIHIFEKGSLLGKEAIARWRLDALASQVIPMR